MSESRSARFIRRAIGWPLSAAVVAGCGILVEATSLPSGRVFETLGAMMFLAAAGVVWIGLLALSGVIRLRTAPADRAPIPWRRWVAPPIVVAFAVTLVAGDVPLRVRFALSRTALDQFARTVVALPAEEYGEARRVPRQPPWVGLFPIDEVWRTESGMRFTVKGTGFLGQGGFAYFPERPPRNFGHEYERFDEPWVLWFQDSF